LAKKKVRNLKNKYTLIKKQKKQDEYTTTTMALQGIIRSKVNHYRMAVRSLDNMYRTGGKKFEEWPRRWEVRKVSTGPIDVCSWVDFYYTMSNSELVYSRANQGLVGI
jgi:hypothetical protein